MLSSNYWYKQARILDYLSLMRTFLETLDTKPDILLEIKAVDCCFNAVYIQLREKSKTELLWSHSIFNSF